MDLNKVCRTCLTASEGMKSLYDTSSQGIESCLAEILMLFTPLKYSENDGYPTTICHHCITDISKCYTFRLKCLESDEMLRNRVQRGIITTTSEASSENTTRYTLHCSKRKSLKQECELINLENDVVNEDSRIFEEVSIKCELYCQEMSLQQNNNNNNTKTVKCLKDPLTLFEMQTDMEQELDIVKHEVDEVDVKIEKKKDILNVNEEKEKPYSCTVCCKSYTRKNTLQMHMRTHTGGGRFYSCTVCDRSFNRRQHYTAHMRTHTGEKPYTCTVCDHSFGLMQSLKFHMSKHTGEKRRHPCTFCERSFNTNYYLTCHMRTHTGEKPFTCTQCDLSFRLKQHLKFHMRTHTGEKPYSCTVCNKSYPQNQKLKQHMLTHTGEKPYTCTVCNNSYTQNQNLKRHMLSHQSSVNSNS